MSEVSSLPSLTLSKRLEHAFREPSLTSAEKLALSQKELAEKAWYNYGQGDKKLYADWAYFYNAYVPLAGTVGLGPPTTMMNPEGSVAALFVFVHELGPRNIVQALIGNMKNDDVDFKKCILSLLIITITFLRQKLGPGLIIGRGFHNRRFLVHNQVIEWSSTALYDQIIDQGVVSACVRILATSSVRSVQELALRFLCDLVRVSEDAALDMLQHPGNLPPFVYYPDRTSINPLTYQFAMRLIHSLDAVSSGLDLSPSHSSSHKNNKSGPGPNGQGGPLPTIGRKHSMVSFNASNFSTESQKQKGQEPPLSSSPNEVQTTRLGLLLSVCAMHKNGSFTP